MSPDGCGGRRRPGVATVVCEPWLSMARRSAHLLLGVCELGCGAVSLRTSCLCLRSNPLLVRVADRQIQISLVHDMDSASQMCSAEVYIADVTSVMRISKSTKRKLSRPICRVATYVSSPRLERGGGPPTDVGYNTWRG